MSDLAVYLLRSGACLAVFYVFYRLVLEKDTNFALNRAFLVGSAALSLVLPLARVPSPFVRAVVHSPVPALSFSEEAARAAVSAPALEPADVLLAVYAAGAGLFLLLFLVRIGRIALMAGRCGCERHRGLRIVLCGRAGESFSFFNFVFLNKANIPAGDLDRVLAHELAHVRQYHSLDIVVSEFLTVIQWFNPFVWPYRRSLRETHEYLADRAVIAQGCGLARYQLLIVEQHVGGRLLELASSFRTSQIKRRIAMLSKQETRGLARWKPLLILPLALVFVLAFAESRTIVVPEAQEAVQASPAGKTVPVGEPTEEEMIKAFKETSAKLEEMKKKGAAEMDMLKKKYEETTDPAVKEKILSEVEENKLLFLEIGAKERMIQMRKLEWALGKETDTKQKAEMEHKLQQLRAETDEYMKKLVAAGKIIKLKEKKVTQK
ncbi:MAG: M56 family metallopeptidase [Candidatus Aminicenantales bacterium]